MGFLKKTFSFFLWRSIEFAIIFLVIVLIPWLPPDVKITPQKITPPKPIDPSLQKRLLNNVDHVLTDKLIGPECFVEYKGNLYAGVHGGEVIKITPEHKMSTFVKFGKPCAGRHHEHICGKPLGMKIANDNLYVADAYYGIWKVSMLDGRKEQLVSPKQIIDGKPLMLFNHLDVASNGDVFWSHSSTDFELYDGVYVMLADGTGRLVHYKASEKTNTVLLDGLWFANGVALSPDEEFVVVCESSSGRIGRYYLKGPKKGQMDIFIDGLPGVPDNLYVLPGDGGILVGIYSSAIQPDKPLLSHSMAPLSWLRKFLLRVVFTIEQGFKTINQWYPSDYLEKLVHKIGHFSTMSTLVPKGFVCRYDWNGELKDMWYGDDDSVHSISGAYPFNGKLYLGSPDYHYIGVIPLPESLKSLYIEPKAATTESPKKAAPEVKIESKPQESTPNVQEKPQPKPTPKVEVKKSQGSGPSVEVVTEKPNIENKPIKEAKPKEDKVKSSPKAKETSKKPEVKPITEELNSDTRKPHEPTLKVIQKDGPTEIPNPGSGKKSSTGNKI